MPRRDNTDSGNSDVCPTCAGSGHIADPDTESGMSLCPTCAGIGIVAPAAARPTRRRHPEPAPQLAARAAATATHMPASVRATQYRNTIVGIEAQTGTLRDTLTAPAAGAAAQAMLDTLTEDIAALRRDPAQAAAITARAAARARRLAETVDSSDLPARQRRRATATLTAIASALATLPSVAP